MIAKMMARAMTLDLADPAFKYALLTLADQADDDGLCVPSPSSLDALGACLDRLLAHGYIAYAGDVDGRVAYLLDLGGAS